MSSYAVVNSADPVVSSEVVGVELGTVSEAPRDEIDEVEQGRLRALTYSPFSNEKSPTALTFSGITVQTKRGKKQKTLINNVSGTLTGGFWAVMGSSGSGKTTLLSVLALRLDSMFFNISGEMKLNGRDYSKHTLKSMSAYVMQDDLLHAELTVQETIDYAARLRIPEGITEEERNQRVQEVMELMGVTHCKDTIIGNTRKKGISGGERKRVCVAIELLNRPKLIFLDEPTSGLDSKTALSVCLALKHLADIGACTVVCTIHQPQPKIFDLFDNLLLMKKGEIVYQGSAGKSVNFLNEIGFPVPENEALADHLLNVVSGMIENTSDDGNENGSRKGSITDYINHTVDLTFGNDKPTFEDKGTTSWWNQFSVLFTRNFHQYFRRKDQIVLTYVATSVFAIFVSCGIWKQIGTDQFSVQSRVPSLFFACVFQGVLGSLQSINSFPGERAIMLRERASGAYHVSAYFAAKAAVDMIQQFFPPVIFSCIVYFTIGYRPGASHFFIYMFFMILEAICANSYTAAVACTCVSVEMTSVVVSVVFEGCRLFGGLYQSPAQVLLAKYRGWRFADALSYIKYAFVGLCLNELQDLPLQCVAPATSCPYNNGNQIIEEKGYDHYTIGECFGLLIVLIVSSQILAYIGLRFIKV